MSANVKSLIKFWTTIIVGGLAINLLFNWLETRAHTNDPPHPRTPAQLESLKAAAASNLVSVAPGIELNRANQLYVHGKLVGTVTTNSFVPVPQVPGFAEGVQIGVQLGRRNPDVRDPRMLVIMANEAWEQVKGQR